jgi:hypothetical protein
VSLAYTLATEMPNRVMHTPPSKAVKKSIIPSPASTRYFLNTDCEHMAGIEKSVEGKKSKWVG